MTKTSECDSRMAEIRRVCQGHLQDRDVSDDRGGNGGDQKKNGRSKDEENAETEPFC